MHPPPPSPASSSWGTLMGPKMVSREEKLNDPPLKPIRKRRLPKLKRLTTVGKVIESDSTRKVKSVDSFDCLRYHRIEDFVAEASAFDNVLITYKPLNECVMCYQEFYPTELTLIYYPLRTKNTCRNCKLVIYTIVNMN